MGRVAAAFPKLSIVCYHGFYPYVNEIIGIAFRCDNVFLVPDMYIFLPGWQMYVEAANGYLQDPFLFGTAYPALPFKQSVERFLKLPLRRDVLARVLHGNAARLLGIST